jgi:hypothetical protein
MKVHELISLLEECDPEAEVYTMVQPNYPFECAFDGVATRGDWVREPEPDDDELQAPAGQEKRPRPAPGPTASLRHGARVDRTLTGKRRAAGGRPRRARGQGRHRRLPKPEAIISAANCSALIVAAASLSVCTNSRIS